VEVQGDQTEAAFLVAKRRRRTTAPRERRFARRVRKLLLRAGHPARARAA